jgi:hypothetical protein
MNRYWCVNIEMYESGAVKAAVIQSRLADNRPPEYYKQEYGREIFGEWFNSETEAQAAAVEARSLNAVLLNKAKAA